MDVFWFKKKRILRSRAVASEPGDVNIPRQNGYIKACMVKTNIRQWDFQYHKTSYRQCSLQLLAFIQPPQVQSAARQLCHWRDSPQGTADGGNTASLIGLSEEEKGSFMLHPGLPRMLMQWISSFPPWSASALSLTGRTHFLGCAVQLWPYPGRTGVSELSLQLPAGGGMGMGHSQSHCIWFRSLPWDSFTGLLLLMLSANDCLHWPMWFLPLRPALY